MLRKTFSPPQKKKKIVGLCSWELLYLLNGFRGEGGGVEAVLRFQGSLDFSQSKHSHAGN